MFWLWKLVTWEKFRIHCHGCTRRIEKQTCISSSIRKLDGPEDELMFVSADDWSQLHLFKAGHWLWRTSTCSSSLHSKSYVLPTEMLEISQDEKCSHRHVPRVKGALKQLWHSGQIFWWPIHIWCMCPSLRMFLRIAGVVGRITGCFYMWNGHMHWSLVRTMQIKDARSLRTMLLEQLSFWLLPPRYCWHKLKFHLGRFCSPLSLQRSAPQTATVVVLQLCSFQCQGQSQNTLITLLCVWSHKQAS